MPGSYFGKFRKKSGGDNLSKEEKKKGNSGNKGPDVTAATKDRHIRVFVSSTFRDMKAEREYLVKNIFPRLRKLCSERYVAWGEVDLRWGITDEESAEGQVLPICLEEIKNCQPYFIGILGERYGWMPDNISEDLLESEDWLKSHREKSVTELEILHGVLNEPEMAEHSFFYFRDASVSKRVEDVLSKEPDYRPDPEASKVKLKALKDTIREKGFPLLDGYSDVEAFGEAVYKDLEEVINRLYPLEKIPDPLDREAMDQESYARALRKLYLSRPAYDERLAAHVHGEGPPLIITGESGSGKSALLANWSAKYRKENVDDFLLIHFIGSTRESADYIGLMVRIMGEIKRRYKVEDEIPSDPQKIREAFSGWLDKTAGGGRFVLILDALNQLEDRDNAPDLGWLPCQFPPNIRVILSTLPGRSLNALKERGWPEYEVKGFTGVEERKIFIKEHLEQYTKGLNPGRTERIASASQSENPLFLKALLEELRVFGSHEELDSRIGHYLKAKTLDDLFELILKRWEEDYEGGQRNKGLVKDAMSLIWCSRRGLTETELLEIMGDENGPLPHALWSPLYLAAEESLVMRSGLLNFAHDYLRKAVHDAYIPGKGGQQRVHMKLADYFSKVEIGERKVDELPYQLKEAKEWERLKGCVSDLAIFTLLNTDKKRYELLGYWLDLGEKFNMVEAYNASLARYEEEGHAGEGLAFMLNDVGYFLNTCARYGGAEPLFRRALEIREKVLGPEHPDTATSLNNLAMLHKKSKGDYEGAEPLFRRALDIDKKVLGQDHPDTASSLSNLATLLLDKGDYEGAEPFFRRALEIREKALGPEHPDTAISLNNLADLLRSKGDYDSAEPLFRRALGIYEKVLGPEHPSTATSLNNLAGLLQDKGDNESAEPLYRRALGISEKVLGPEHPDTATSVNNLAGLLDNKGDYEGAELLYRRVLGIWEKVLGSDHPGTALSLNNLAALLQDKGDYESAEPLLRRALGIREKALGPEHPDTVKSLNNLAGLLQDKGDYDGAEPLYRRVHGLMEKVLGPEHPDTVLSLDNLAVLLDNKGDYDGAEPLYRRALGVMEKVLGPEHPDTVLSLKNLVALLYNKGDLEGTKVYLKKAFLISEKTLGPDHPNTIQIRENIEALGG